MRPKRSTFLYKACVLLMSMGVVTNLRSANRGFFDDYVASTSQRLTLAETLPANQSLQESATHRLLQVDQSRETFPAKESLYDKQSQETVSAEESLHDNQSQETVTAKESHRDNKSQETVAAKESLRDNQRQGMVPAKKSLQEIKRDGLLKLNQSHAFQLARIQSLEEISRKAVVRSWEPCRLHQHLSKKKFHAVVLGGSASARPADNCTLTPDENPEEGRYSDILEFKLRELGIDATIYNRAQGSATSTWSGMNIEHLVDPLNEDIDLIIWEHSINDWSNYYHGTADQMLAFFLARVENHYKTHNKPPPPVLVVYLWKAFAGGAPNWRLRKGGIGYRDQVANRSLDFVDSFNDEHRLPIQVLKVPNVIDMKTFIHNRTVFLDDVHHPACQANHLLADMIQYVLLDNMPSNETDLVCPTQVAREPLLPAVSDSRRAPPVFDTNRRNANALSDYMLEVLLDSRTTIRAVSHWKPSFPESMMRRKKLPSLLSFKSEQRTRLHQAQFAEEKLKPGRADRKISYRVPTCNDTESGRSNPLEFTFAANNWEWLCVLYKGKSIVATLHPGETKVPLTGKGMSTIRLGGPMNDHIQNKNWDWIDLREYTKYPSGISVSFCDSANATERLTPENTTLWSWIHLLATVKP